MPSKPMPDHFLNYSQVAELLGLEVETLKKGKAGTRDIPRIKLGSRVLFSFNAVQRWMAAQARKAEEDRRRRETVVIDLLVEKRRRQIAVENTLKTIINGGKYRSTTTTKP